jgi:hypothetical protein
MSISIASLHALWHRNQDKPKSLFMLIIPEDDPQPYISIAYYPGGWLIAQWANIPIVKYEGHGYVPLILIERERRKIFYSIWHHFKKVIGDQPELLVCPINP